MILYFTDAKSFEHTAIVIICYFFVCQQGGADCSHNLVVGWNNNLNPKLFLECLDDSLVKGNPALKYYWGFNLLPQADIIKVVAH